MDADGGCFVGLEGGTFISDPHGVLGLRFWVRADLGVTIATGVSQWNDQSGWGDSNQKLVQATGANQPAFSASVAALGNKPSLNFNGTSHFMTSASTWATPQPQPFTAFAVAQLAAGGGFGFVMDSYPGSHQTSIQQNGGVWQIYAGNAVVNDAAGANPLNPCAIGAFFTTPSDYMWVNKHPTAAVAHDAGTNNLTGMTVGGYEGGGDYWKGYIAEIIVYTGSLTLQDFNSVMNYLGGRYSINIS